jgi:hypothetical protein
MQNLTATDEKPFVSGCQFAMSSEAANFLASRLKRHLQAVNTKLQPLAVIFSKGKGKAVPLQAWSGPEGSRKLRFLDFMTTANDGGKVVSLTHRPPLPPRNTPGTHFC